MNNITSLAPALGLSSDYQELLDVRSLSDVESEIREQKDKLKNDLRLFAFLSVIEEWRKEPENTEKKETVEPKSEYFTTDRPIKLAEGVRIHLHEMSVGVSHPRHPRVDTIGNIQSTISSAMSELKSDIDDFARWYNMHDISVANSEPEADMQRAKGRFARIDEALRALQSEARRVELSVSRARSMRDRSRIVFLLALALSILFAVLLGYHHVIDIKFQFFVIFLLILSGTNLVLAAVFHRRFSNYIKKNNLSTDSISPLDDNVGGQALVGRPTLPRGVNEDEKLVSQEDSSEPARPTLSRSSTFT